MSVSSVSSLFSQIHIAYDTVTIATIPKDASIIAVYVDGAFANLTPVKKAFPNAKLVTITVFGLSGARFIDCEPGDVTPIQAARWAKAEIASGRKPGIYFSVGNWGAVEAALTSVGLHRSQVILWTAHYTHSPHICGPGSCAYPGFDTTADGTQYTDVALGRNLDANEVTDAWIGIVPPPKASGIVKFEGSLNLATGKWDIHGTKSDGIVWGLNRNACALIAINESNGQWSLDPQPFNKIPVKG